MEEVDVELNPQMKAMGNKQQTTLVIEDDSNNENESYQFQANGNTSSTLN